MKICSSCDLEYEFYGQRSGLCRPCKRVYDREYHSKRSKDKKAEKLFKQKCRIDNNRQYVFDFFKSNPCEICGEKDPVVLEFDHLDPSIKVSCVSEMLHYSLDKLKLEICKCRVLCANCHRRHTSKQFGWYKNIKF